MEVILHKVKEIGNAIELKVARKHPPTAPELSVVLRQRIGWFVLGIVRIGPRVLGVNLFRLCYVVEMATLSLNSCCLLHVTMDAESSACTVKKHTCKMKNACARIAPSVACLTPGRRTIRGKYVAICTALSRNHTAGISPLILR